MAPLQSRRPTHAQDPKRTTLAVFAQPDRPSELEEKMAAELDASLALFNSDIDNHHNIVEEATIVLVSIKLYKKYKEQREMCDQQMESALQSQALELGQKSQQMLDEMLRT